MTTTHPTVSVIVLNHNGRRFLSDCFHSLEMLDYPADRHEIVLVDNASTDGSTEHVASTHPKVRVIRCERNTGFAEGNNIGVAKTSSDLVALLNNDMRVESNWLAKLVKPLADDPAIAATCARVFDWQGRKIDFGGAALNFAGWGSQVGWGDTDLDKYAEARSVIFPYGGAMLMRRDAFIRLGGFDNSYFAYFEDVDLGWRAALAGMSTKYVPDAIVYHHGSGSWKSPKDPKKWLIQEHNTLCNVFKNYGDALLCRALPAATLLLAERAYQDIYPAIAVPPVITAAHASDPERQVVANAPVYDAAYYAREASSLLRSGRGQALLVRSAAELKRRLGTRPEWQWRIRARPRNGRFVVPSLAIARLAAAHRILSEWTGLLTRRADVQRLRQVDDSAFTHLFLRPLMSNFAQRQHVKATQQVIGKLGLTHAFEAGYAIPQNNSASLALEAVKSILQVLDAALAKSGIEPHLFALDAPAIPEVVDVPVDCVQLLARCHALLWALPGAPIEETLKWLSLQVKGILEETG